jgi:hypothetical protein
MLSNSVLRRGTNLKNGGTNHASRVIMCSSKQTGPSVLYLTLRLKRAEHRAFLKLSTQLSCGLCCKQGVVVVYGLMYECIVVCMYKCVI